MSSSNERKILTEARRKGLVRPADFRGIVNPSAYLARLARRGALTRVGRGLYAVPGFQVTGDHTLAEAARRFPSGVVCLLSALAFHGFTTQNPSEVWMAFRSNFTPAAMTVPVRAVRMSESSYRHGIEKHRVEGAVIRVYTPAKTVADLFKFRGKAGLDVAMEALREGWHERKFTMDELWQAAKVCRVQQVIRPYLEMLVSR